jgi:outer membrane translocation and assembly module TamA
MLDDLFGERTERDQGVRVDWRAELAPAGFDHDVDFRRYVATARGWWHPASRRIVSGRAIVGTSHGVLPPQRVFALGGIGSVRGYRFKEAVGEGMLLLNGEIRQRFGRHVAGLAFIDAGRVYDARPGSTTDWLKGVGVGFELGEGDGPRVEFGWRLDDIPSSLQVLFRLRHTF